MNNIYTIYCDFDGTITKKDSVNTFFEKYAKPEWFEYEKLWIDGKISSQKNAEEQVKLLPEMSEVELFNYIDSLEIDEYFLEFIDFIQNKNINLVILSDGFDLFIEQTLKKYKLCGIKYYANHLIHKDNKFNIEFPYHNNNCKIGAGMCKCNKVKEEKFCYIGDGTSDLCIAKKADKLFAKKKLKQYCVTNLISHYSFENFSDIIKILKDF